MACMHKSGTAFSKEIKNTIFSIECIRRRIVREFQQGKDAKIDISYSSFKSTCSWKIRTSDNCTRQFNLDDVQKWEDSRKFLQNKEETGFICCELVEIKKIMSVVLLFTISGFMTKIGLCLCTCQLFFVFWNWKKAYHRRGTIFFNPINEVQVQPAKVTCNNFVLKLRLELWLCVAQSRN